MSVHDDHATVEAPSAEPVTTTAVMTQAEASANPFLPITSRLPHRLVRQKKKFVMDNGPEYFAVGHNEVGSTARCRQPSGDPVGTAGVHDCWQPCGRVPARPLGRPG
ncbi:hypothetical protein GCM10010174_79000 [Kutzneria viridogrisea]